MSTVVEDLVAAILASGSTVVIAIPGEEAVESKEEELSENPYEMFMTEELYPTVGGGVQDAILMDNPLQ